MSRQWDRLGPESREPPPPRVPRPPRNPGPGRDGREPAEEGWSPGRGSGGSTSGGRGPNGRYTAGGGRGGGGSGGVRQRLMPRTAAGLAAVVVAAAIGAAFSGSILYSYYEYRLQKTNDRVNTLIDTYKKEFQAASGDLAAQTAADKATIDKELGPLSQLQASGGTIQTLVKKLSPSLFFVKTADTNGQPSVGTAWAIASDSGQTLLITSYATIAAATKKPGPQVVVSQGSADTQVTVYAWDPPTDLALIILPKGNVPALPRAPSTPAPQSGDRVFIVSGLGSLGGQAAQGAVTDVNASGIAHTAPVGPAFQGGPMVNADGQVVAVASRSYAPLSFQSDSVWYAPMVGLACNRVLSCPGGGLPTPGARS